MVWLNEVINLLERVGRDADKLIQPSHTEKDAFRLFHVAKCHGYTMNIKNI